MSFQQIPQSGLGTASGIGPSEAENLISLHQTDEPIMTNTNVHNQALSKASITDSSQKHKLKVLQNLLSTIPILNNDQPKTILIFLMKIGPIYEFHLVNDQMFIFNLLSKLCGRALQICSTIDPNTSSWELVQNILIRRLIPTRVREDLAREFVTRRCQGRLEHFHSFVQEVVRANQILKSVDNELTLVNLILQNVAPNIRAHFVHTVRPTTINGILALADELVDSLEAEHQWYQVEQNGQPVGRDGMHSRVPSFTSNRRDASLRTIICWHCRQPGHVRSACPNNPSDVSSRQSGN